MIRFSEEFKEALLKAKGDKAVFVIGKSEDGGWDAFPNVYSLEGFDEKKKTLTLKAIVAEPPSEESKTVVKGIIESMREKLKADIVTAVEAALLEKTPEQLSRIASAAPSAKLEHRRGCFWLITDKEEICL